MTSILKKIGNKKQQHYKQNQLTPTKLLKKTENREANIHLHLPLGVPKSPPSLISIIRILHHVLGDKFVGHCPSLGGYRPHLVPSTQIDN